MVVTVTTVSGENVAVGVGALGGTVAITVRGVVDTASCCGVGAGLVGGGVAELVAVSPPCEANAIATSATISTIAATPRSRHRVSG